MLKYSSETNREVINTICNGGRSAARAIEDSLKDPPGGCSSPLARSRCLKAFFKMIKSGIIIFSECINGLKVLANNVKDDDGIKIETDNKFTRKLNGWGKSLRVKFVKIEEGTVYRIRCKEDSAGWFRTIGKQPSRWE